MDKDELLRCMVDASDALAEFDHVLPQHSPPAHQQVMEARQHFEYAITLLKRGGSEPPYPRMRLVG